MIVTDRIDEYFALMEQRPRLFASSDIYPIVTDRAAIEAYESQTGKKIGVLYKSRFNTLVVDLIAGENGYFTYERVIPTALGHAVVCIPVINGRLLLVNQYRHAVRDRQLSFPRGFGEDGIAPADNAKKELFEEVGAVARECILLGSVSADSGLVGAECDVFLCYADSFAEVCADEGITGVELLDEVTLEELIRERKITDGFTLGAYMLYKTRKK